MDGTGYSLSDIAAITNDGLGNGGAGAWWMIILFAMIFGWGGNGFGGGFNNAIGYENLATSAEMQRGFDNQNSMANQRDILSAVNSGTAQAVAATKDTFHDTLNALSDKYSELQRDIAALAVGQQQGIAAQNDCCCSTKMLISEQAAQLRYDSAMQANATQQLINDKFAALEARDAQREIDNLRQQVGQLQLAQATQGVVRYPDSFSYNAGANPFCGCMNYGCNI